MKGGFILRHYRFVAEGGFDREIAYSAIKSDSGLLSSAAMRLDGNGQRLGIECHVLVDRRPQMFFARQLIQKVPQPVAAPMRLLSALPP